MELFSRPPSPSQHSGPSFSLVVYILTGRFFTNVLERCADGIRFRGDGGLNDFGVPGF